MFQEDYIMRQIEGMVLIMARLLFNKDTPRYELPEDNQYTQTDFLHMRLLSLLGQGKIKEAKEELSRLMAPGRMEYLEVALDFYSRVNEFGDETLEKYGVTRQELEKELMRTKEIYGIQI